MFEGNVRGYRMTRGVDGKLEFVERTVAEKQRYDAAFDVPRPVKVERKTEAFIQITMSQLEKLLPDLSKSPAAAVFLLLLNENFRHRGSAFVWPTEQLSDLLDFNPQAQRRARRRLVELGLISVERRHRNSPTVQVLMIG